MELENKMATCDRTELEIRNKSLLLLTVIVLKTERFLRYLPSSSAPASPSDRLISSLIQRRSGSSPSFSSSSVSSSSVAPSAWKTSHSSHSRGDVLVHVDTPTIMEFLQLRSWRPSLSPFPSEAVLSRVLLSSKASFRSRSQCLELALRGSPSEESDVTSSSAADTFAGFSQMNHFITGASADSSFAVFTDC